MRGTKGAVRQVFVGGRQVVDNGRVTRIDRDAVLAEIAERLSAPETASEAEGWEMVNALVPHLENFIRDTGACAEHVPYRFNALHPSGK